MKYHRNVKMEEPDTDQRCFKKGNHLPPDTIVYYPSYEGGIIRLNISDHPQLCEHVFIHDVCDKLWATRIARVKWSWDIKLHPYCTLFALLYEKLKYTIT